LTSCCNLKGNIESRGNITIRGLIPIEIKAGVTIPVLNEDQDSVLDKKGKPIMAAKYTGLHAFRHFFASWCINRRADGGLELPPKVVPERLGHSSIGMTMDVYGHLFPRGNDGAELAAAASHLFAPT
jgi:integrase